MSAPLPITAATAGLPITSQTHAPATVRNGSTAVKQAYATAQGFEEMLLGQLSQALVQSSGLSGEEGGGEAAEEGSASAGGEAGGGMLSSLLPQTLTEGVMRQGGIGLATQLMGELAPAAESATTASGKPAADSVGSTGGAAA